MPEPIDQHPQQTAHARGCSRWLGATGVRTLHNTWAVKHGPSKELVHFQQGAFPAPPVGFLGVFPVNSCTLCFTRN